MSKDSSRRLIVKRLMEPLLIVKHKVLLEIGESGWHGVIVLEVNLSEGVTPSARLQNRA